MRNLMRYRKKPEDEFGAYLDIISLFQDLIKVMDVEDKKELAHTLGMDETITEAVIERLCGDTVGEWEHYEDYENIQKILSKMEKHLLWKLSWGLFYTRDYGKIIDFIEEKRNTRHIYWKMVHEPDPQTRDFLCAWLKRHDIESEHTTKVAEEEIEELKSMVEKTIENLISTMEKGEKHV